MGLAASQARLLTITARKADCEFESMNLSHQKIALSRDMERVSTEYQNALSKTKLVYDYYGSSDKQTDLTYRLLMEPSIYNDYVPKLLTDPTNRVILNSTYAEVARAVGIPAEGLDGLPSSDVRDAFIDALYESGVISETRASSIKNVPYNNAMGVGASSYEVSTATEEITYKELMDRINSKTQINTMQGNAGMDSIFDGKRVGEHVTYLEELGETARLGVTDVGGNTHEEFGSAAVNTLNNVTLSDLLTGDTQYYLSAQSRDGELTPLSGIADFQRQLIGSENGVSFLNWLNDAFASVLGGVEANETALQYAYNAVYDVLHPTNNVENWINEFKNSDMTCDDNSDRCEWYDARWEDGTTQQVMNGVVSWHPGGRTNDSDYHLNLAADSSKYLGLLATQELDGSGTHADRKDRSQVAVNLNNLAKTFITAYVQFFQGLEDSKYKWQTGKMSDCTMYDPNIDKNVKFLVSAGMEIEQGDSVLYAGFYDALFNRICLNGWTENDKVDDKDYMQEMIKSGKAFISAMSDDGFYYQGNYAADKTILEVADDEAIARAQAKYNTEKTRIEYKENRIDMKMKNLDTEISSLTTEYDTAKQLISKTVEKSFKRYEA